MKLTRTAVVGLLALLVATAGIAAAAPTADTETTSTSTTSEVVDGTTLAGFNASSSNYTYVEASGMTSDGAVKILDPDTGTVFYTNTSLVATNKSAGYFAANISNAALDNLPASSGQNETYTVRLVNNSSLDNPATTNLTLYVEGQEGRTVIYGSPKTLSDDSFELPNDGIQLESVNMSLLMDKKATVSAEDVAINGTNSTVTVHFANATADDRLGKSVGDLSSGTWDESTIVTVDGEAVKAYVGSAPDDVNTSSTYAVVDTSKNDVTIHTGDGYEGDSEIDSVSVTANAGWSGVFSAYGLDAVTHTASMS